ncbi:acid-sensing (proton-gated) ion channel [Chamberlinius hualienensis]
MPEVNFVDGCWSTHKLNDRPIFMKRSDADRRRHHIIDMSRHIEEFSEYRQLFNDFFLSTTIHGCNHLGSQNHPFRKMVWFVAFVIGIAMAIYQSGSLINEYRRYAVMESTERKYEFQLSFPSVTVCVNIPIRWSMNFTEEVGRKVVTNTLNRLSEVPEESVGQDNASAYRQRILFEEMSHLTESERFSIGFSKKDYVIGCSFGLRDCLNELYEFNNFYYGNCVTFNPGFSSKTAHSTKLISLNLLFFDSFNEVFPYLIRDLGPVFMVHSPGSAPTLNSDSTLVVFAKRWVTYQISQVVNNRLPSPYSSHCIGDRDIEAQKTLLHYKDNRPYIYTTNACYETCFQTLSMRFCNCTMTNGPFPDNNRLSLCPHSGCDYIYDAKQVSQCKCRQPCREVSYNSKAYTDDRWTEQNIWVDVVNRSAKRSYGDIMHTCGVNIIFDSNEVVYITEVPKILWADFLGSIGGNVGLWVGLSVLSILELIELMFQLFTKGIKTAINRLKKQH